MPSCHVTEPKSFSITKSIRLVNKQLKAFSFLRYEEKLFRLKSRRKHPTISMPLIQERKNATNQLENKGKKLWLKNEGTTTDICCRFTAQKV